MDLLTGGDLRFHIAHQKTFSEMQTKFFISNMLLALEYIHSQNIIHRDIKPENLVLESTGYLRITDFGVAKINEIDNSSETSGTPGYMAPEVILVQNHSFPSDFFALGVIGALISASSSEELVILFPCSMVEHEVVSVVIVELLSASCSSSAVAS